MVFRKAAGWGSLRNGVWLPHDIALVPAAVLPLAPPIVGEPITFSVIDAYDNLSNLTPLAPATVSQGTPIFGTNGSADLALNGSISTTNVQRTAVPWTQVGANDLILMAFQPPDDPMDGEAGSGFVNVHTNFRQQSDTGSGEPNMSGSSGARFGKRWLSASAASIRDFNWAGATLDTLTAPTYTVQSRFTPSNIAGPGVLKIGPIVRVTQRRKSILTMTFDDNYAREHDDVLPLLTSRFGTAPATSYVSMGVIGTSLRFTLGQMAAMKAAGWCFGLNSGPTDQPIFAAHAGGVADAVAALDTQRAALVATGLAADDDARHICYSFGTAGPADATVTQIASCVSNGTTTITCATAQAFFNGLVMRGAVVTGAGVPAGTTVVSTPNANTITVNQPVPSNTTTLTFHYINALTTAGGLVASGATTITSIRTTGLIPGMRMQGRAVPAGTTIVSIDTPSTGVAADGTITVSQNVGAACTRAGFYVIGGEWLPGRIEAALIAAGYKTGRRTNVGQGLCTQFGIPSAEAMMSLNTITLDAPVGTVTGGIQQCIRDGRDIMAFMHVAPAANMTDLATVLDFIKARVDAGELDVMTVPAWYNRIAARSGIA